MAESRRPCKTCGRNRAERFFVSAKGHVCSTCRKRSRRRVTRDVHLLDTYGITEAEYQSILDSQGGACAICKGKRPGNLDVDHDHQAVRDGATPRQSIRGLLCRRCNRRLLPAAQDSIDRLQDACTYLVLGRGRVAGVIG